MARRGEPMNEKRFEKIYEQKEGMGRLEIWEDKATGVQYLYRSDGYSGGLTVMVDKYGDPVAAKE